MSGITKRPWENLGGAAGAAARTASLAQAVANRRAEADRAPSSSGWDGKISPNMTVGGLCLYVPDTLPGGEGDAAQQPLPAPDWKLFQKGAPAASSVPVILCDPEAMFGLHTHSVREVADTAPLPRHLQNSLGRDVKCRAGTTTYDGSLPLSPNWKETPEGKLFLTSPTSRATVFAYEVEEASGATYWAIEPPENHPIVDQTEIITADAQEEAQRHGEWLLHTMDECPWCLYDTHEKKSPIWRPAWRDVIPGFSLRWYPLEPIPPKDSKDGAAARKPAGKDDFKRPTHRLHWKAAMDFVPSRADVAIMQGWFMLEVPTVSNKSQKARTMENYVAYVGMVGECCASCLTPKGGRGPAIEVVGSRGKSRKEPAHRLHIREVRCPITDTVLMGEEEAAGLTDAQRYELGASYLPSPEIQMLIRSGQCSLADLEAQGLPVRQEEATGDILVIPVVIHECNSCENPVPLRVSQVRTLMSKDAGGFFTFEVDEADGIVRRDWTRVPGTQPAELTVAKLAGVDPSDAASVRKLLTWGVDETYAAHMTPEDIRRTMTPRSTLARAR